MKLGVMVGCAYETVAIASDMTRRNPLPTISVMCSRHRFLSVLIVAALAFHLRPRKGYELSACPAAG
jgi:hypothetical protein